MGENDLSHLAATIHVDASPEIVFDLLADPSRGPEWQTMLAEMGEVSGRSGGVGSSYVGYYRIAGRRIEGRFVITAAERPTLHQAAGTTRGGWARWTTMIEPAGRGANVRVSLEYELPGEIIASVLGLLTGTRLQRAFRRTYANLKRVAEADAARALNGGTSMAEGPGAARHLAAE